MRSITRSYSELITILTFKERLEYLKISGSVGELTFNGHRYLNQRLYKLPEWKTIRRRVIIRDNGCDLACQDREIFGKILIHHLNPLSIDDIINRDPMIFDINNLVCCSLETHNAIHYGREPELYPEVVTERTKGDTCLWRS